MGKKNPRRTPAQRIEDKLLREKHGRILRDAANKVDTPDGIPLTIGAVKRRIARRDRSDERIVDTAVNQAAKR